MPAPNTARIPIRFRQQPDLKSEPAKGNLMSKSKFRPLLLKLLYPDIAGLARSNLEFLGAFFGEGLEKTESAWYSHAVRWRNNRRTRRFLDEGALAAGEASHFDQLTRALPAEFVSWGPLARGRQQYSTPFSAS